MVMVIFLDCMLVNTLGFLRVVSLFTSSFDAFEMVDHMVNLSVKFRVSVMLLCVRGLVSLVLGRNFLFVMVVLVMS